MPQVHEAKRPLTPAQMFGIEEDLQELGTESVLARLADTGAHTTADICHTCNKRCIGQINADCYAPKSRKLTAPHA